MSIPDNGAQGFVWPFDGCFRILDTAVRIRCVKPDAGARIGQLLAPFSIDKRPTEPADHLFSLSHEDAHDDLILTIDEEPVANRADWAALIGIMLAELNALVVSNLSCFAAHAGAVASAHGVVTFPSESGGGKSTLTAACLLAGFEYVSDEALCLDLVDGAVLPYPKPITLDSRSLEHLDLPTHLLHDQTEAFLTPGELGSRATRGRAPLRHVVVLERGEGAPQLDELPRSEIVSSLLRSSFNHYKHPDESYRLLTELASRCQAWRLRLDAPMEAARLLQKRLLPG